MAVRQTMGALILRVRDLINDNGSPPVWSDQQIQDIMDGPSRTDFRNEVLKPSPTFSGSTLQYLDYYHHLGDWEDDLVIKQYLVTVVTPSTSENIVGHWTFAATTLPPLYITGKSYDVYRSAADLLERWAAKWTLNYDFTSDGQSFRRSQAATMLQALAKTYRLKQRPVMINATRGDMVNVGANESISLSPTNLDYYGSGDGR